MSVMVDYQTRLTINDMKTLKVGYSEVESMPSTKLMLQIVRRDFSTPQKCMIVSFIYAQVIGDTFGLQHNYVQDPQFAANEYQLLALAFVPTSYVNSRH